MYTTPICPFCVRAKTLLAKKGAAVEEIDVFMDADARKEMQAKTGGARTVPQIFIGDTMSGAATSFMPWSAKANWIRCSPSFWAFPALDNGGSSTG